MSLALLERAVDYTRGQLALVHLDDLARPTPCRAWDLAALLAHMEDSLDAFLEASRGAVSPYAVPRAGDPADGWADSWADSWADNAADRLGRLRTKACHLLGSWAEADPGQRVLIGDRALPADTLLEAAALEIAVHGWDVAQAIRQTVPAELGEGRELPDSLAGPLLFVAVQLVTPAIRSGRFDDPIGPGDAAATYAVNPSLQQELLGFLGRKTHQSHALRH